MLKRIPLYFVLLLVLFSVFSCQPENLFEKNKYKTYTIKKGEHYSEKAIGMFNHSELKFMARFDNSAIYENASEKNRDDINKLYGFSDCGNQHHENSARFGWVWNNDKHAVDIFAYCYVNGTRESKYITTVELDKVYEYKIKADGDKYIFSLDDKVLQMNRGCNSKKSLRFYLHPYFGGDETAPHDVNIYIDDQS